MIKTTMLAVATTALMGSAAMAEITFSGNATAGLTYDESISSDARLYHDFGLTVTMAGQGNGGLNFGAVIELSNDNDADNATLEGSTYVGIGNFMITAGHTDGAMDYRLGEVSSGGLDTELLARVDGFREDDTQIRLDYDYNGFGVSVSADSDESGALAASYSNGNGNMLYTLSAGVFTDGIDTGYALGASVDVNRVSADIAYVNFANGAEEAVDLGLAYAQDRWTVGGIYSVDLVSDNENYGLYAGYDLGGGANLLGSVGQRDGDTVASIGISMNF